MTVNADMKRSIELKWTNRILAMPVEIKNYVKALRPCLKSSELNE